MTWIQRTILMGSRRISIYEAQSTLLWQPKMPPAVLYFREGTGIPQKQKLRRGKIWGDCGKGESCPV